MKNIIQKIFLTICILAIFSCHRTDENDDVLSQEDISNIILNVSDGTATQTYNYAVNSATNPMIKLTNGKTYTVSALFKNGNADATQDIISAKNEHFLIFNFINSNINLTRIAGADDLRADGKRIGLTTTWQVVKAANGNSPQLILTLNHDASSVNEAQNGTAFGSVIGGETDAVATFGISN